MIVLEWSSAAISHLSVCVNQGKITAQGKLLLQDNLMVAEHTSKMKVEKQMFRERRVFLFEQIIIFSEEIDKKRSNLASPGYIFRNSIKVIPLLHATLWSLRQELFIHAQEQPSYHNV